MGQISLQIPQVGNPNSTEAPKIAADMTAIQSAINGNLDGTNLAAALAQSAAVNQSGQVVKGAVSIPGSETRTSTAYGLMPTPDQVTGIVLPSNGLIAVWYQATWQNSVAGTAQAAIFLGASQLKVAGGSGAAPQQAAGNTTANVDSSLGTSGFGLVPQAANVLGHVADVTTGQVVGVWDNSVTFPGGGPCYIFAAAGTYTVAIMFKSSSGSVTASNRKLWVEAKSFI